MTQQQKENLATDVKGILGKGSLNWLGNFNQETKREQFNIFFNKESQAIKALDKLSKHGDVKIVKTPKFVNTYFKFSVTVTI